MSMKDIKRRIYGVMRRLTAPDRSRVGKMLFELHQWCEVSTQAEANIERLWGELEAQGFIPADDILRRTYRDAEAIVIDGGHYAVQVKVVSASYFNRDAFIAALCDEFKIRGRKLERLNELLDKAREPGTARLTKNVIPVTVKQRTLA